MSGLQFHQRSNSGVGTQKKYYSIEFRVGEKYPFNGVKPSNFQVSASTKLFETTSGCFSENIDKLTQISSNLFIQLLEIIETHSASISYTLKYEYVPHSLVSIREQINFPKHQSQIEHLCKQLASYQIQIQPKIEDFGFMGNSQLKYFLRPNFTAVKIDTKEKEIRYVREMMEKFEYGFIMGATITKQLMSSLDNRSSERGIEGIAEKIRKLRHNLFKVEMKNQEKKAVKSNQYASEKNPSENSENNTPTLTKQELGFQESRISSDNKQHFFEDSYSWRDAKIKKKRTSSFQLDQKKPKSENKYKKASWGEKCSVVESDKATVLKKRVTDALLKTQNTLNKYQKIRTKSSRKIK